MQLYQLSFPNGKKYIGISSQTAEIRFKEHCKKSRNKFAVNHAIKKYGIENIVLTVLATVDNWELLCLAEIEAIEKFNTFHKNGEGYNLTLGGDGVLTVILSDGEGRDDRDRRVKKAYKKQIYAKNKRQESIKSRKYRENNKESIAVKKKAWQERNAIQLRQRYSEYYIENKNRVTERNRIYAIENKDAIANKNKEWREKNKEELREKEKIRYEKNKTAYAEKGKEYRLKNKESIAAKKKADYWKKKELKLIEDSKNER